ncbi:MAG TPA: cell division protein FtsA [Campylobacterales bacterium]|nr:cell division protein FtsA [Campylobacterales bacterium]
MSKNILAIDVGSTKVCAIIAEDRGGGNGARIIGAGVANSQGLKKGSITNIDLASKSIKTAFEDAKRVAGTFETEAIVSISGAYTKSIHSSGIVNVPMGEVTITEIDRVMQTARYNANIQVEYDILHILPYNFKVDEQDFVEDPLGMNASRLEVFVHIVVTPKSNFNNLKRAVELAGLKVKNIVLNSYASYIATVNPDEKSLGVAVVDMGGNTSSFVIQAGGNSVRYHGFLAVGSEHITNDLSRLLHTPPHVAENVKITYGNLNIQSDDLIELPIVGDETSTHEAKLDFIREIVHARVAETLGILADQIYESGLRDEIGAGVVLTGGLTKLEGVRELAMAIFNTPVRLATPKPISGLFESLRDPAYSTAIGLVMYGAGYYSLYEFDSNGDMKFNEDSIKKAQIPNEISLDNISPKSFQKSLQQSATPKEPNIGVGNERVGMNPMSPPHQPSSYSQMNQPQPTMTTPQPNEVQVSPTPQTNIPKHQQQQPIANELHHKQYYEHLRSGSSQLEQDKNGVVSKLWQWVTQLF